MPPQPSPPPLLRPPIPQHPHFSDLAPSAFPQLLSWIRHLHTGLHSLGSTNQGIISCFSGPLEPRYGLLRAGQKYTLALPSGPLEVPPSHLTLCCRTWWSRAGLAGLF